MENDPYFNRKPTELLFSSWWSSGACGKIVSSTEPSSILARSRGRMDDQESLGFDRLE